MAHLSWNFFFGTSHYYYFHLPFGPFHAAKFKKILTADPELWGCAIFGPKMSICLPKIFFWKIIHIILIDLSLYKIWAQNGPFPKMRIFLENLLMSLVSFIHAYLHAKKKKKKSKSDINLLVKYWLLKSHWARAIFGYNLRTRFFPNMPFLQNFNEP